MSARRVSRREFLAGLGAAGALAAGGYGVQMWTRDASHPASRSPQRAASHPSAGDSPRTLVLLELAGGNDALNTVVPHADPQYRRLRPTLAVTEPIDLDGHIGLSPKLSTLADQYRAGRLAIVEGVGVPNPNLSHFASLQRWWTADPDLHASTGWLGRYLDRAVGYDDPLAGIAIGPGPSPVLAGASSFAASITGAQGLQPARLDAEVRDTLLKSWASLVPAQPPPSLLGRVQRSIHETLDARTRLADDLGARAPNPSSDDDGTLADALELAARLAASKDHPRVIHVHVEGDFDTHEGEAQRHPALMTELDAGIKAFLSALDERQASDHVVLATMSEFGRRAAENGLGTDHGAAAAHLVLGASVKGGRHGEPSSLTTLDAAGNLVATVDYRAYDAALLEWLDPSADLDAVLGTDPGSLHLFS
jgi:uncharacterized protein (DUF1501 family)